MKKESKGN